MEAGADRLLRIDPGNGKITTVTSGLEITVGESVEIMLRGVALDSAGRIYISTTSQGNILIVDPQ